MLSSRTRCSCLLSAFNLPYFSISFSTSAFWVKQFFFRVEYFCFTIEYSLTSESYLNCSCSYSDWGYFVVGVCWFCWFCVFCCWIGLLCSKTFDICSYSEIRELSLCLPFSSTSTDAIVFMNLSLSCLHFLTCCRSWINSWSGTEPTLPLAWWLWLQLILKLRLMLGLMLDMSRLLLAWLVWVLCCFYSLRSLLLGGILNFAWCSSLLCDSLDWEWLWELLDYVNGCGIWVSYAYARSFWLLFFLDPLGMLLTKEELLLCCFLREGVTAETVEMGERVLGLLRGDLERERRS